MSDPVKNSEMEDVLSSIRRLVSEEKRPHTPVSAPCSTDRLVLTPALRVASSDGTKLGGRRTLFLAPKEMRVDVGANITKRSENGHPSKESVPYDLSLARRLIGEVVKKPDPQRSDIDTMPLNLSAYARPIKADSAAENAPEKSEDRTGFDPANGAVSPSFSKRHDTPHSENNAGFDTATKSDTLSVKIAALETAIGAIDQEWEPDDAGTDAYSGTEPPALDWEGEETPLDAKGRPLSLDGADIPDEIMSGFVDKLTEFAFKDADIQAVTTNEQLAGSPDRPDSAVQAVSEDVPETQVQAIDDAALRAVVGDIVRAELQGALGERITRNVRKLVRREINRALATHDLD